LSFDLSNPTSVGVCRPFFLKQGVVYYKIKWSVVILMRIQASYLALYTTGNTATHTNTPIVVLVELYKFFSARPPY